MIYACTRSVPHRRASIAQSHRAAEYDWYLALVRDRQQNVNEFFDVLLGTHHRRK